MHSWGSGSSLGEATHAVLLGGHGRGRGGGSQWNSSRAVEKGGEQQEWPGCSLLHRKPWESGRVGGGEGHRGHVTQPGIQSKAVICIPAFRPYKEQSAHSVDIEKAGHLTWLVQFKTTAPHKEWALPMLVHSQQQHGHCVFSRPSCCLIEWITGLRLQK